MLSLAHTSRRWTVVEDRCMNQSFRCYLGVEIRKSEANDDPCHEDEGAITPDKCIRLLNIILLHEVI